MIDIVDQISQELENERRGRAALKGLPISQILGAFPDEMKTARRERNRLRREVKPFINQVQIIKSIPMDQDQLVMALEILKDQAPKAKFAVLAQLESLCSAYKAIIPAPDGTRASNEGINDQMVEWARSVGIEGLYSWEKPKRIGRRFQACCPFHQESSGSFFVFADNKFKCFGCQEHGDAIDFIQKTLSMDFIEAVKYLQGRS